MLSNVKLVTFSRALLSWRMGFAQVFKITGSHSVDHSPVVRSAIALCLIRVKRFNASSHSILAALLVNDSRDNRCTGKYVGVA